MVGDLPLIIPAGVQLQFVIFDKISGEFRDMSHLGRLGGDPFACDLDVVRVQWRACSVRTILVAANRLVRFDTARFIRCEQSGTPILSRNGFRAVVIGGGHV